MNLQKYIPFIIILFILGCENDVEKIEIETEKIVNGRIRFSVINEVPENLKVLSLDGITELDSNTNINLPSSSSGLEFLLNSDNEIVFLRKKYELIDDNKFSSTSTILFLSTFNTKYYSLSNNLKNLIVNQILEHPNFINAKSLLDNSSIIDISSDDFKHEITMLISEIYSEENIISLSRDNTLDAPLVDVNYSNNSNIVSISNNTSNHIGYSVKKDDIQISFGLIEGNQNLTFGLNSENSSYAFKMMSGADISGVFSNNQLEEIEAFNADFNDFLFEALTVILELAIPELNDDCLETIFSTLTDSINFAESYGNNNNANDAFSEAFTDMTSLLPSMIQQTFDCIEVNGGVLGQILNVLNVINDIFSISNFLNETAQSITEYYAYENLSEKCFFYNGIGIIECDNISISPAFNPNPSNYSTEVPLTGQLIFTPGANTPNNASYKIYFGSTSNPSNYNITTSPNNTYSVTQEETTYYWRVETLNNDNSVLATSPIWNFTTSSSSNSLSTLTTNSITNITNTSASSGGNITNNGGSNVTTRGICWSTNSNPTTSNNTTSNGNGNGNFTSQLTNLNPNTTYFVRAYATNSTGTAYGNQQSFTTNSNNNSTPVLTTTSVTNVTETSASSGGNVTSNGGSNVTARGICWGTNSNPTTSNNSTNNGSGNGNFTSQLINLNPNTTYFVRAYATNSAGTAYGNQHSFTTSNNTEQPNLIITNQFEIDDDMSGGSDGNDNGIPEAGEVIELKVQLQNVGNATASNVMATLTTNDNDINITDAEENYGTIQSNSTDWNTDFDFEIDSNCPTKTVNFNLDITSDEGNWQQSFSINVQGSNSGSSISITPSDNCNSAPIMQVDTEYEVTLDVSDYGLGSPIDGQSSGGNNVRGFWLRVDVPNNYSGAHDVLIYDVSSNFNPVVGLRGNCNGNYLGLFHSSSLPIYVNQSSNGGSETATTNMPGIGSGQSDSNDYYIRIYHYVGNETPNISFKIKVE